MAIGFTVLASGSKGNAALVQMEGAGLLLDAGLGPRALVRRLEAVGQDGLALGGVLLTHTHGDHAHDLTLQWLARRGVAVHCHEGHLDEAGHRPGFLALARAGSLRVFDDRPFWVAPGLWVEAIELSHTGPTFGFRLEGRPGRRGRAAALGYLTDTGRWDDRMADALADVDLLGIEFNHDVDMERRSGRSPALIRRNLGDRGHLSNEQAADLLAAVIGRSGPGAVARVVLLHLSEQCNRPELAEAVARAALRRHDRRAKVDAARQSVPLETMRVTPGRRPRVTATAGAAGFPWES